MAQANMAQREPSMEEILASIRRIIEDGDGAAKAAKPAAEPAPPPPTAKPQPTAEVTAFRAELKAEPSVRAFPANFSRPAPIEPPREDLALPDMPDHLLEEFEADLGVANDDLPDESDIVGRAETLAAPSTAAMEMDEEPSEAEPAQAGKPAIISDHAGRQVAAAFGELSEAFAASRRRSFDEVAEEMMRPMLQDWLDNNLPTLVERLVREEIERVARGGAR